MLAGLSAAGWQCPGRRRAFPINTTVPQHKARSVLRSFGVRELNRPGNEPWPQPHPTPLGWFGTDRAARSCCQTSVLGLSNALVAALGKKELPKRCGNPSQRRKGCESSIMKCKVLLSAYFWTRFGIKLMLLRYYLIISSIKRASKWKWAAVMQDRNTTKLKDK